MKNFIGISVLLLSVISVAQAKNRPIPAPKAELIGTPYYQMIGQPIVNGDLRATAYSYQEVYNPMGYSKARVIIFIETAQEDAPYLFYPDHVTTAPDQTLSLKFKVLDIVYTQNANGQKTPTVIYSDADGALKQSKDILSPYFASRSIPYNPTSCKSIVKTNKAKP